MIYTQHQEHWFSPTRITYTRPRRLETYVYAPRSKVPPNWQKARSFVRMLCLDELGTQPHWGYTHQQHQACKEWYSRYKEMRADIQAEDYPINL